MTNLLRVDRIDQWEREFDLTHYKSFFHAFWANGLHENILSKILIHIIWIMNWILTIIREFFGTVTGPGIGPGTEPECDLSILFQFCFR